MLATALLVELYLRILYVLVLLDLLELLLVLTSLSKLLCNEGHLLGLLLEGLVEGKLAIMQLLRGLLAAELAPDVLS